MKLKFLLLIIVHHLILVIIGEEHADDIDGRIVTVEKKFSINFNNIKQKFTSICIAIVLIVFCLLMK